MTTEDDAVFKLQETLYTSRNPTRRMLHVRRRDWILDAIQRWGKGATAALEVGPGSGVYLPALSGVARDVVGSDIEHAYLDRLAPLEQRHENLRLVWDDITNSAFGDDEFDLVLCSEVVEHIKDARPAFREMHRILRPDGVLILSTPQSYSTIELASRIALLPGIVRLTRLVYREIVMNTGHVNLMTRRRLDRELREPGFVPVERWFCGMYLPIVAETLGERAVRVEVALEQRLRDTKLRGMLWTQFIVARPAGASRSSRVL